MLTYIVSSLLASLCVIPGGALLFIAAMGAGGGHHGGGAELLGAPLFIAGIVLLVPGALAAIYLGVCWVFALPIVVDHQVGFWVGMQYSRRLVSKHWWTVLGLLIVASLVASLGMLLCCVGMIVTVPVSIGALVTAYERMAGSQSGSPAA